MASVAPWCCCRNCLPALVFTLDGVDAAMCVGPVTSGGRTDTMNALTVDGSYGVTFDSEGTTGLICRYKLDPMAADFGNFTRLPGPAVHNLTHIQNNSGFNVVLSKSDLSITAVTFVVSKGATNLIEDKTVFVWTGSAGTKFLGDTLPNQLDCGTTTQYGSNGGTAVITAIA